jgi:phage I-like protein
MIFPELLAAVGRGELELHQLTLFEQLDTRPGTIDIVGAPRPPFVPPTEVRLFRFGDNPTQKGVFKVPPGAEAILAADAAYGNEYPFDYCHAMLEPPPGCPPDQAGKAAGWFRIEVRADGIYAAIKRLTPAALKYLEDDEYQYTSPAFFTNKEREVVAIINCAFTNIPATNHLAPLVKHQRTDAPTSPVAASLGRAAPEAPMKGILAYLGLSAETSEAEAVASLSQKIIAAEQRATEANGKTEAARAETKQVLDALGVPSVLLALPKIEGLVDAAAKGKEATEKLSSYETQRKADEKAKADAEVKALLDAAEKSDGKGFKLTPASRKVLEPKCLSWGPEGVKEYLSSKGYEAVASADTPAGNAAAGAGAGAGAGQGGDANPTTQAPATLSCAPPGSPPRLLARFEDYYQGDLHRDLERLSVEQPAEYQRLRDDYQARKNAPRKGPLGVLVPA